MRLIDADLLLNRIREEGVNQAEQYGTPHNNIVYAYADCFSMIKNAPSVEANILKYGKWLRPYLDTGAVQCSLCGSAYSTLGAANYCPNCGAKMMEEAE